MIFLQRFILWGLPLVLIPVLIHLLNRLRYKTIDWGAMPFLLAATRQSSRRSRLKQWLLLASRILAVFFLILFLARPALTGNLGDLFSAQPDQIIILVDRSASMGLKSSSEKPLLNRILTQAANRSAAFPDATYVLIDSLHAEPIVLPEPGKLADGPWNIAVQGSCTMQSMLQRAFEFLQASSPVATEIWLLTDHQESGWPGQKESLQAITNQLTSLPQAISIRLFDAAQETPPRNLILAPGPLLQKESETGQQVTIGFDVQGDLAPRYTTSLPMQLTLNGNEQAIDIPIESDTQSRFQYTFDLNSKNQRGWGRLQLPADDNPLDNEIWFVYAPQGKRHTIIVSDTLADDIPPFTFTGADAAAVIESQCRARS